ncbi:hypothetical protein E2562_033832 [Oryza meyeriana var. granulata]|uniref:Uncharacterized protein n=1 Tax=Oryza meyeriana var. granulata TaxID=110450 RepID=A0A6G1F1E5_9ORYZ|nr:hypothetical protein E2562_033832 [Oryza meyeriana var. granulata]
MDEFVRSPTGDGMSVVLAVRRQWTVGLSVRDNRVTTGCGPPLQEGIVACAGVGGAIGIPVSAGSYGGMQGLRVY